MTELEVVPEISPVCVTSMEKGQNLTVETPDKHYLSQGTKINTNSESHVDSRNP